MQQREFEETRRQIEEDADREILAIKNKYESRLREEVDTNMRLKGESGIMRKKVRSTLKCLLAVVRNRKPGQTGYY